MPYVSYISDEILASIVEELLNKASSSIDLANKALRRNVVDPFSAIFEMAGFELSLEDWETKERARQAQKHLSNHIGNFHQKILGSVAGWTDLQVGQQIDLKNETRRIIAEVKNKHNTVKGSNLSDLYKDLDNLVSPKLSSYFGFTAYVVQIIPSKKRRFNIPFTPSDKSKGKKCHENEHIRIIDGFSFYELVTGRPEALKELFQALPKVIEKIKAGRYKFTNFSALESYFISAFGEI